MVEHKDHYILKARAQPQSAIKDYSTQTTNNALMPEKWKFVDHSKKPTRIYRI